jgi:hypothetical protein
MSALSLWEDPSDWLFDVTNDWSMADKMLRIGVRFAMLEGPSSTNTRRGCGPTGRTRFRSSTDGRPRCPHGNRASAPPTSS